MYVTDGSNLYTIDPVTGVRSSVGAIGYNSVRNLAVHPVTGVIYAVSNVWPYSLITIDPLTGDGTLVGVINTNGDCPVAAMAIDAAGNAYITGGSCNIYAYYSLNLATAVATYITNLLSSQGQGISYMANGDAWYAGGNEIYPITLATGALLSGIGINPVGEFRDLCDYGGELYGARHSDQTLCHINTTTGVVTAIGSGNVEMGLAATYP